MRLLVNTIMSGMMLMFCALGARWNDGQAKGWFWFLLIFAFYLFCDSMFRITSELNKKTR